MRIRSGAPPPGRGAMGRIGKWGKELAPAGRPFSGAPREARGGDGPPQRTSQSPAA